MRVIVTRPAAQAAVWVQALKARGVDAQAMPLIGIAPPQDVAAVENAWQALAPEGWVMFVSANAVEQFFALRPAGTQWPEGLAAGSTGPGTSAALRDAGVVHIDEPPADAPQFDSEALWAQVQGRAWAGRPVWVVRGEEGRDWLAQRLEAAGAQVHFVSAYRRLPPVLDAPGQALLAAAQAMPAVHCWLFSSSEAVGHLTRLAPGADWSAAQALASHPRIAEAARAVGFGRVGLVGAGVDAVARFCAAAG